MLELIFPGGVATGVNDFRVFVFQPNNGIWGICRQLFGIYRQAADCFPSHSLKHFSFTDPECSHSFFEITSR